VEQGDREDADSNSCGLSYVNAPIASLEGRLQEICVITDKLVELNPGGYKLFCELATN
jgi:hypothetical protein